MTKTHPALAAWQNATRDRTLTPLLTALGDTLALATRSDKRRPDPLHQFSQRIATSDNHDSAFSSLGYRRDWRGEWEVTNADLEIWGRFRMWLDRYTEADERADRRHIPLMAGSITAALQHKRLWQAWTRYQTTGLTLAHCELLANLLWDMDVFRGDWISLHVQGKRPMGNSSIEYDIFEHAGWPMTWGKEGEDVDMPDAERERAWNLFDELVFAAPDAARLAAQTVAPAKAD